MLYSEQNTKALISQCILSMSDICIGKNLFETLTFNHAFEFYFQRKRILNIHTPISRIVSD